VARVTGKTGRRFTGQVRAGAGVGARRIVDKQLVGRSTHTPTIDAAAPPMVVPRKESRLSSKARDSDIRELTLPAPLARPKSA